MFGTLLNKLQNYTQMKEVKTINSYSAKQLSVAASSTAAQAWGTAVAGGLECHARSHGSVGTHVYPLHSSFQNRRPLIHYHPLPISFIYMKHTAEYILISQELYWCSRHFTMNPREPAAFGRSGCLYKPLGVFHFNKNQALPFLPHPLNLHLPKSSFPAFTQAVHRGTPDQCGPATLVDSHNVSSALLVDKGIDYQILQRI